MRALRRHVLALGIGAGLTLLVILAMLTLFGGEGQKRDQLSDTQTAASTSILTESPSITPTPTSTATPTATAPPSPTLPHAPTLLPPPTPTTTPSPTPYSFYFAVNAEQLSIYAAPGENYEVLYVVRRGDRLLAAGRLDDGTWWQVDFFGMKGWLPAQPVGPEVHLIALPVVLPPDLPTATLTPTREPVLIYQPVPLGTAANASLNFKSPPTGDVTLGGVPFQLSARVFKSQASPSPNDSYPISISLPMNVPQAYRVHLLLNAGNGFNRFSGKVVGQVVAYCNGTLTPLTELQLGRDIREWHVADNVVSNASRIRQVWSGVLTDFPNLTGHIDMLSLDLPSDCQSGRLTALEVIDSSVSTVNSLDPALNLIGVTVEHYQ